MIALGEVTEHVAGHYAAIANIVRHQKPNRKNYNTTTNPAFSGTVLRAIFVRSLSSYYDHSVVNFQKNLLVFCYCFAVKVSGIYFCNAFNGSTPGLILKSWLARHVGFLCHRLGRYSVVILELNAS